MIKTEMERCSHTFKPYHVFLSPMNYMIKQGAIDGIGPFLDVSKYPEVLKLGTEWRTIWEEYDSNKTMLRPINKDKFFTTISDEKWKRIKLKFYGKWKHQDKFPNTIKLLKTIPGLHAAMISVLEPGARINPHVGLNSACARVHLGLQCPLQTKIRIMDNHYSWKVGEIKMFDDTFLHGVVNDGDFDRVVLFLDVERKTRSEIAKKLGVIIAKFVAHE